MRSPEVFEDDGLESILFRLQNADVSGCWRKSGSTDRSRCRAVRRGARTRRRPSVCCIRRANSSRTRRRGANRSSPTGFSGRRGAALRHAAGEPCRARRNGCLDRPGDDLRRCDVSRRGSGRQDASARQARWPAARRASRRRVRRGGGRAGDVRRAVRTRCRRHQDRVDGATSTCCALPAAAIELVRHELHVQRRMSRSTQRRPRSDTERGRELAFELCARPTSSRRTSEVVCSTVVAWGTRRSGRATHVSSTRRRRATGGPGPSA